MIPVARPSVGPEEKAAVLAVLDSGQLAHGPVTEAFEREFAAAMGAPHAVAVANGTAALHLALLAAGVGPGDEVVTTPFTFVATANAIRMVGARPVFADIDPATYNLDAQAAGRAMSPRTKALMPVHLYGLAADLQAFEDLASQRGVALVEDAAQAHGATCRGKTVGSVGAMGCFSMYPTKNMTTGEGGMVTCREAATADALRSLRNHGRGPTAKGGYDHVALGYNFRLTDIASAIGRVQLARLPAINAARRRNAKVLDEAAATNRHLSAPQAFPDRTHVYHQYTVRTGERARFVEHMRSAGIGTGVYYPCPSYAYPHLSAYARTCPNAEAASREVVSLPVHQGLTPEEVAQVAAALRSWRG